MNYYAEIKNDKIIALVKTTVDTDSIKESAILLNIKVVFLTFTEFMILESVDGDLSRLKGIMRIFDQILN